MRALLLLALGVFSVWAVLYLYPRGAAQAGELASAELALAALPAEGPTPAEAPLAGASTGQPDNGIGAPALERGRSSTSAGELEPARASGPDPDAARLGQAIVHGGPEHVRAALQELGVPADHPRSRLALAFAEATAANGDRARAAELLEGLPDASGIDAIDLQLLGRALGRAGGGPLPEAARTESPLTRAMAMVLTERRARALSGSGEDALSARLWSDLLLAELSAPWPASRELLTTWTADLKAAQRNHRWNPRGDWPGITVEVRDGDSLVSIRKRVLAEHPALLLCTGLIERANRLGRYIQAGEQLRVPTDPVSTLVDLDARWLLYLHGDEVVDAWEVGVGKQGEETLAGRFVVREKQENPMWWPVGREPVPFGHPENPLGTRWIGWEFEDGEDPHLGFHGTNEPETIGKASSLGCIRLRNEDVEDLFQIVPVGSPVTVRN